MSTIIPYKISTTTQLPITSNTYTTNHTYTIQNTAPSTNWSDIINNTGNVQIMGNAECYGNAEFHGNVKIKGKDIVEMLTKIEERLAILKPNTELESRWEELKELSKRYRELEAELVEKEKVWSILKK